MSRTPVQRMSLGDANWVEETLASGLLPAAERDCLEFLATLLRHRRRLDVEVEEAPRRRAGGDFDIELAGEPS